MKRLCLFAVTALCVAAPVRAVGQPAKPLAEGLPTPAGVAAGPDGRVYVTVKGEKDGDGAVYVLDKGKAVPFAKGMDEPRGIVSWQKWLYVADRQKIWKIDGKGKADVYVKSEAFPTAPVRLTDLVIDIETGTVFVCDIGDEGGKGAVIYRIPPKGKPGVLIDAAKWPELKRPGALVMDGQNHLLILDAETGTLWRYRIPDGDKEKVAEGFGTGDGMVWDRFGRLYISDAKAGKLRVIPRPGMDTVTVSDKVPGAAGVCLDAAGKNILLADRKGGAVLAFPAQVPGMEVKEDPLSFEAVHAFPDLKWTGWKFENEKGQQVALRPIVLTHAGDGSNRVFVATEHGVIHVFPNDPKADKTKVFLDITDRVIYDDKQNEEGFLGLAFHPKFKENGEFFVFYTLKATKKDHINLVSRFRVSKDDPDKADPASEEVLLRIERPFWNHDGGTLCFGPDGYLYLCTGDGGLANDPQNNGQNLKSLLAKVLRIDVDHKDEGLAYAIPKDNPFVGRDDARPETWAYGLRNIWRMSFDRKTGVLWAGDIGQNLYEEINLIVKGGNYGWKIREGMHPFSNKGVGVRKDLVEPIWEYHHSLGVCIIGGNVYRGKQWPELDGLYIYADYVTGRVWGLRYDEKLKRVTENRQIRTPGIPILSFGEDEQGEVYYLTTTLNGRGIYQFQKAKN
jgi:glucose/arabinose dehydrogenase